MLMPSTFFERIDELSESVGSGKLVMDVVVDQVYAKYQEVREDLHHPRGGQAHALAEVVLGQSQDNFERLALRAVTPDGSELVGAARDLVDKWVERDYPRVAPVEYRDLGRSGHPKVVDDGAVVYDKLPAVHRLTKDELKRKSDRAAQTAHGHRNPPAADITEFARQRRVRRRELIREQRARRSRGDS